MGLFNRKISQAEFSRLFIEEAQLRAPSNQATYLADSFSLQFSHGGQMFLGYAYHEYTSAKKRERHEVLARFVRIALLVPEAHDDFADVCDKLLPYLRPRFALEVLKFEMEVQNPDQDSQAFDTHSFADGHFCLTLALDAEDHIASVADSECARWGVSYESALEVAKGNLRERSPGAWSAMEFEDTGTRIYLSTWQDCYEPSRLLVPDLIEALEVQGSHVVLCPTRSHMIVIGSEDRKGLEIALALAETMLQEDRIVSMVPMILTSEGWKPYHPEDDHPDLRTYRVARLMERAREYSSQKELLDKILELRDIDKFVASFSLYEAEDEGDLSMVVSTWTCGVETYLPESESISLFDSDNGQLCIVPFAKALEVVPHRLKRLQYYPPRYETIGFPTAAEVEAMGGEYRPIDDAP